MAMHKGMCGRTESTNGPESTPFGEKTLGDYLVKKYPEEMKKKLTFEEWAVSEGYGYWYAPNKMQWSARCRVFEVDLRQCWKAAQENV